MMCGGPVNAKELSSNMEDYLEAIAALKDRQGVARVRDIGRFLNVKTPSVTSALNVLSKRGFVSHERYGYVELTGAGAERAERVQSYHNVLVRFLTEILSIDRKTAEKDACRMEHALSQQTFQKLAKFMEFVAIHRTGVRPDWLKGFDRYFKTGRRQRCKFRRIKLPAAGSGAM
jgi:DtxR family transcriptional regulator, Mn-dependent transcriptional regulator